MAPVDGGAQRPVPRRGGPVAGGEQPEPVGQPLGDLLHRQCAYPRGRQFDRQRHAVQRPAQRGDRADVGRADGETGQGRGRPVGEQPDRLVPVRVLGRLDRAGRRDRHRRYLPHRFRGHPQRLTARGDHDQPLRGVEQALAHHGARVDEVLAVVQNQQQPARGHRIGERVEQRPAGLLADTQRRRHPGDHQVGLPQVAQVHEADAIGERPHHGEQDPQGQPGLPDTARPAERERPGHAQQFTQLPELVFAAHEVVRFLGHLDPDLGYLTTVSPPCPAKRPATPAPAGMCTHAAGKTQNNRGHVRMGGYLAFLARHRALF